jgi:hypothetical protein
MSETVAKLAARKGRVPALVAALAVAAWLLLNDLVHTLIDIGWYVSYAVESDSSQSVSNSWLGFGLAALGIIPVALGIFVSLWAIAPVSHELELRFVLTRAALAALAGSILAAIVDIVFSLFSAIHLPQYWFSNTFSAGGFEGGMFLNSVIGSLIGIVTGTIGLFPLVGLVVVLLWLWLRDHPREYEISGLIDEL